MWVEWGEVGYEGCWFQGSSAMLPGAKSPRKQGWAARESSTAGEPPVLRQLKRSSKQPPS